MPYDRHKQRCVTKRKPTGDPSLDWLYEWEKASWAKAHPDATPKEYEAAIRAICRRLGY